VPGIAEADTAEVQPFEIAEVRRRRQNAHTSIAEVVVGKIEERYAPQGGTIGQIVGLVACAGEMHHLDRRQAHDGFAVAEKGVTGRRDFGRKTALEDGPIDERIELAEPFAFVIGQEFLDAGFEFEAKRVGQGEFSSWHWRRMNSPRG